MNPSVGFMSPPSGSGPWWCPVCDRVTVTCYRCSNGSCGVDLTDRPLETLGGRS